MRPVTVATNMPNMEHLYTCVYISTCVASIHVYLYYTVCAHTDATKSKNQQVTCMLPLHLIISKQTPGPQYIIEN